MLPIYIWSSGSIQVSHAILIVSGLFVLLYADLRLTLPEILMAALAGWVFSREAVAAIEGGNITVLIFPVYITFNFILLVAVMGLIFFGYDLSLYSYERAVGTFNNPNQLGYFAVCLFSITSLLYLSGYLQPIVLICIAFVSLALAILSLSKAAMISVFLPFVALGFVLARPKKKKGLVGPAVALGVAALGYFLISAGPLGDTVFVQRLSALGTHSDDSLAGRGYTIILEASALEVLFGLGAEETSRIYSEGKDVHKMHEVHSTVFSFFVTYGIVGGLLFLSIMLLWVAKVFRGSGLIGLVCITGPPLAYGLTHNGSRFTLFWMLVALSFALAKAAKTVPAFAARRATLAI
jgi:hypothetical protein